MVSGTGVAGQESNRFIHLEGTLGARRALAKRIQLPIHTVLRLPAAVEGDGGEDQPGGDDPKENDENRGEHEEYLLMPPIPRAAQTLHG